MMVIVPLTALESFLPGRRYDLVIQLASSLGVLKSADCSTLTGVLRKSACAGGKSLSMKGALKSSACAALGALKSFAMKCLQQCQTLIGCFSGQREKQVLQLMGPAIE